MGNVTEPSFNYASFIGMLQYLQGHNRPDIVSQCRRYIYHHNNIHIAASKRIGKYFLNTSEKFTIWKLTSELTVDCYVEADFAGLWNI